MPNKHFLAKEVAAGNLSQHDADAILTNQNARNVKLVQSPATPVGETASPAKPAGKKV